MRRFRQLAAPILLLLIVVTLFTGCREKQPINIGFIGGISGRVADLGVAGRNGVMLAVEEKNEAGGIHGRPVELLAADDEQNPETAQMVIDRFLKEHIELIIGPMTSSMAMAVMPQINASKAILLSPTVTTTDLQAKDDNFLRVISTTSDYSAKSARFQFEKLGYRTVAAIYDSGNSSYTESWYNGFRNTFEKLGGKVVKTVTFKSSKDATFLQPVREMLSVKPDLILIITNAVDSALICQQIRKLDPKVGIAMSEWASTERFTELGGKATDGVVVAQFLNRNDTSDRYQKFLSAYRKRFSQEPGFAGLAGYDAALVGLDALSRRKPGTSLKDTILRTMKFQGVQQQITIDRFGDADRKTFVTRISNGKYVTVE
ncbi:hypothetical protein OR1_03982 [Geobacter sp. OR-1]|uniref:ABC transporter substrate-binding protein n=1 Tax=Geobacter sp. OR-1 TaxID=1266765 RepID=UPI000542681E|nr:ABC transporter substrate-binding protein [Geobacter sp. OR-1]GAM11666.1 hypothetical protein OR1_03982 [Geobacter sp. OR-1]